MKRSAANQLTKDANADDDGEELEGTGFQSASAEALSGRKIRGLPKRKGAPAPEGEPAPKPTFGGFTGFGSAPASNTNATPEATSFKAPAFSGFGGFGTTTGPPATTSTTTPSFNFSAAPVPTSTISVSKTAQLFGGSIASANNSLSQAKSAANAFSFSSPATGSSVESPSLPMTGITPTLSSSSAAASSSTPSSKGSEYHLSLRGLNHSVLSALENAINQDPFVELPLEKITKAYSQYRKEIESKSSGSKAVASTPAPAPVEPPKPAHTFTMPTPPVGGFFGKKATEPGSTAAASPFSLGGSSSTMNGGAPKPPVVTGFSFGAIPKPAESKDNSDSTKSADKPTFLFGSPSNGTTSAASNSSSTPLPFSFGAPKTDNTGKTSAPTTVSFGSGGLFAGPKAPEAEVESKPSLYPFGALGDSKSATPSPAVAPPKPTFFSFGSTPATTPVQTPGTPDPAEKRPSLAGFGFGSSKSTFSFGSGTPGLTPGTGSLGNPVGFAFGSPPKDSIATAPITPSPATTFGLQAAAAAASTAPPGSSVASVKGSDLGSREDTPADAASSQPAGDQDLEGEGEQDESNIFSERAKLYRYKQTAWVDVGTGRFKLKSHKETEVKRILMRTEVGRVILNFRVHDGLNAQAAGKPSILKFNGHEDGQPTLFQVRFKTADIAASVLKHLQDATKSS